MREVDARHSTKNLRLHLPHAAGDKGPLRHEHFYLTVVASTAVPTLASVAGVIEANGARNSSGAAAGQCARS